MAARTAKATPRRQTAAQNKAQDRQFTQLAGELTHHDQVWMLGVMAVLGAEGRPGVIRRCEDILHILRRGQQ